ncbi:MAG: methyltransferase family protein [Sphingomonadales bacterium]
MINNDMAKSGKPFFQRRKYASTVTIIGGALVILAFGGATFDDPLRQFSYDAFWIAVAAMGGIVRITASGFAALGTSGEGKKEAVAPELNTTGVYSLVRNPLYVGRVLTFTGLAFLTGVWEYGALVFLLSILFYERVIAYEEQYLAQKFGDEYSKWCARVPVFLPKLTGWVTPRLKWWWRRLFFRETYKVLDLAATVTAYTVLKDYAATGNWAFSSVQLAAIIVLATGYVVITSLKRFTRIFEGIS